jgi:thiamine biosynthesis protein ThiS
MIEIQVNGTTREVEGGASVADLLKSLGLDGRTVVVERNRQILRRSEIEDVTLEAGDRLEVVQFVGGG